MKLITVIAGVYFVLLCVPPLLCSWLMYNMLVVMRPACSTTNHTIQLPGEVTFYKDASFIGEPRIETCGDEISLTIVIIFGILLFCSPCICAVSVSLPTSVYFYDVLYIDTTKQDNIHINVTVINGDVFLFNIDNASTVDEFRAIIANVIDNDMLLYYNTQTLITGKYMKSFQGCYRMYTLVGKKNIELECMYVQS